MADKFTELNAPYFNPGTEQALSYNKNKLKSNPLVSIIIPAYNTAKQ